MEVILSAPDGEGKTTGAMKFITSYFNADVWYQVQPEVLIIDDPAFMEVEPEELADYIHAKKVKAVMFDACLITPKHMLHAVGAVKIYRIKYPENPRFLSVYCEQGGAVVLTDKYVPLCEDPVK